MNLVCLLLAHLATSGLDAGEASFNQGPYRRGLVDPVVSARNAPDPEDLIADPQLRDALRTGATIGGIDCSSTFAQRGVPTIRQPEGDRPESVSRIAFRPVVLTKDGRSALVAWRYYYHPLNAGGHFATMIKVGGRWTVVDHGRYGPIS